MKHLNYQTILSFVAVFASFSDISNAGGSGCGSVDWQPYKDERCFRILDDTLRTFDDAVEACRLESTSTLPKIRTLDEQNFFANLLFKTNRKVDNFWLGAKFENNSYKWLDNSSLSYTNWATAARNMTDYCVQIQADVAVLGKWIDGPCEKKNLVVCEKSPSFSTVQLHELLVDARRELRDALDQQKHQLDAANKKIVEQKQQLHAEFNKNITDLKQSLIPIGFIYTQLPSDKAPNEIWPWMTWTDVSSAYEGLFFRITGGDAALFGQVQNENAPRVTKIASIYLEGGSSGERNLTKNVWTEPVFTGIYTRNDFREPLYMKFFTSDGEIRPRNMAIRLWRRIR